jgi:hypothetical protein
MILKELKATPDPRGNKINLSWEYPDANRCSGVLIFRTTGQYLIKSEIDKNIQNAITSAVSDFNLLCDYSLMSSYSDDKNLKAEEWYYYLLVPFTDMNTAGKKTLNSEVTEDVAIYYSDFGNRVCAPATTAYCTSDTMFKSLPGIYHRYDRNKDSDYQAGSLQKYLNIFGSQMDLLRSMAAILLHTKNVNRIPGNWIGWQPNFTSSYNFQRNEIRNAPEMFQTIGLIPNLQALVNRVTNCKTEVKEFANNVFITNDPVCTTIWEQPIEDDGKENSTAKQISSHSSTDGTLRAVTEPGNGDKPQRIWAFFHTTYECDEMGRDGTRVEYKIRTGITWSSSFRIESDVRYNKFPAAVPCCEGMLLFYSKKDPGGKWNIATELISRGYEMYPARLCGNICNIGLLRKEINYENKELVLVIKVDGLLPQKVCFTKKRMECIQQSLKLSPGNENIDIYAVIELIKLQCKEVYVTIADNSCIALQSKKSGLESSISIECTKSTAAAVLGFPPGFNLSNNCEDKREPAVIGNDQKNIWLAYVARIGQNSQINCIGLKYNDYWFWEDKTTIVTESYAADKEPYLFFNKETEKTDLLCFWSHLIPVSGDNCIKKVWRICFSRKSVTETESTWKLEQQLSPDETSELLDQRFPCATIDEAGKPAVYYAEHNGDWNIVKIPFNPSNDKKNLVTSGFALAAPQYISHEKLLLFRSSMPVSIKSELNPSSSIVDHRLCGSTSVVPNNRKRIFDMETIDDTMRYTYEIVGEHEKHDNNKWYSFDTVGIYLTPHNNELPQQMQIRIKELVEGLRTRCLPIQLRLVFIFKPFIYTDYLEEDGYELTDDDLVTIQTKEKYRGIYSSAQDRIPEWKLFYSDDLSERQQSISGNKNDRTWHPWLMKRKRNER